MLQYNNSNNNNQKRKIFFSSGILQPTMLHFNVHELPSVFLYGKTNNQQQKKSVIHITGNKIILIKLYKS